MDRERPTRHNRAKNGSPKDVLRIGAAADERLPPGALNLPIGFRVRMCSGDDRRLRSSGAFLDFS